jgi:hypothetical protein
MSFPPKVKEEALVNSLRRCCICHVFAGRDAAVHHIIPESEDGPDTIENAIVLCSKCHGQAGHYNPKHPSGNKYSRSELTKHRDLWWDWCERKGGISSLEDPIGVSPTTIHLIDSHWQRFGQFVVSNRTHDPYWRVWIKLTFRPPRVDLETLILEIQERGASAFGTGGPGTLRVDSLQIVTEDEKGQQVKYLMIDRLRPSDYVYYNVYLSRRAELLEPAQLCIDLWSFDPTPLTWGYEDGQPSFQLEFPQPLRGKSSISLAGRYPVASGMW